MKQNSRDSFHWDVNLNANGHLISQYDLLTRQTYQGILHNIHQYSIHINQYIKKENQ